MGTGEGTGNGSFGLGDGDCVRPGASLQGVLPGVFLIVLDAAALAGSAARLPLPVATRLAGSWIAAAALMLRALALPGGRA